jgi:hypothetical protein
MDEDEWGALGCFEQQVGLACITRTTHKAELLFEDNQ